MFVSSQMRQATQVDSDWSTNVSAVACSSMPSAANMDAADVCCTELKRGGRVDEDLLKERSLMLFSPNRDLKLY